MSWRRPQPAAGVLRWFWAAPLPLGALCIGVMATAVFGRALAGLAETRAIRTKMECAAARLAAQSTAAAFVATGGGVQAETVDAGDGIVVRTAVRPLPGSQQRLQAMVGEQVLDFVFVELPGATPAALGQPLAVAAGASLPAHWPTAAAGADLEFVPRTAAPAPGPTTAAWFVREPSIALLHLSGGTDGDDYVMAPALAQAWSQPLPQPLPLHGVLEVPGNLWIDHETDPLRLQLADDLTVIVRGNAYLGREIRVSGRGHLTIAVVGQDGGAFADQDGNGRRSPGEATRNGLSYDGPVEGAGNVWIGMPRRRGGRLEFDCGLVATGMLHLAVDAAVVHGPLVLGGGGLVLPGCAGDLLATGRRLPSLQSTALPGFAAVGRPRPGPLLQLGGEPLYAASPAR